MQLLETWATARLEALGVDRVFAPYIVGKLPSHLNSDEDCIEDAKCSIHEVLMGWLAPEDEVPLSHVTHFFYHTALLYTTMLLIRRYFWLFVYFIFFYFISLYLCLCVAGLGVCAGVCR